MSVFRYVCLYAPHHHQYTKCLYARLSLTADDELAALARCCDAVRRGPACDRASPAAVAAVVGVLAAVIVVIVGFVGFVVAAPAVCGRACVRCAASVVVAAALVALPTLADGRRCSGACARGDTREEDSDQTRGRVGVEVVREGVGLWCVAVRLPDDVCGREGRVLLLLLLLLALAVARERPRPAR